MPVVTLTSVDDGKAVGVHPGDELVVRLSENPTTGYRWHIDRADGPLHLETDAYHPAPSVQIGSGGVREFRFRAAAAGSARLELKYWQPWEGERSVVERFAVTFESAP
jgi:inhibitor of cysteine peptidase